MPTSDAPPVASTSLPNSSTKVNLAALKTFSPSLHERAWASVPHPTLPLLATAHAKSVTVFSLSTLSKHSALTGGHSRSVRCVAWKPGLPPHKLGLVTGSFDATAGLWRWDGDDEGDGQGGGLEVEITAESLSRRQAEDDNDAQDGGDKDWEFTLVLEGHDSEIKSCAFSPSGALLATCSRDKSVWVWEDIGATEADDEWETVAVLNEHDGDVKAVSWCPDIPGRSASAARRRCFGVDVLASASYDDTARIWREDGDGEWVCVAVLEGHGGTVWGTQWEARPRTGDKMPRLLSWSADGTIRVWELQGDEDQEAEESSGGGLGLGARGALGGIPNTMRRSLREDWACTAILPKIHDKDIYSVAWSNESGLVASTGSDGIVALYREDHENVPSVSNDTLDAATATSADAMDTTPDQPAHTNGDEPSRIVPPESSRWHLLATKPNAHGPYEVNHVTWCRRFDAAERRGPGVDEMLVTTGDDGVVRPWAVSAESP